MSSPQLTRATPEKNSFPLPAFEQPHIPGPCFAFGGRGAVQVSLAVRSQGQASISDRPLHELQLPHPHPPQWLWEGALLSLEEPDLRSYLEVEPKLFWLRYFRLGQSLISLFPQPCSWGQEHHSPKQNKRANNLKGSLCLLPVSCVCVL